MRRSRDVVAAIVLAASVSVAAGEPAHDTAKGGALFDAGSFGKSKEPIIITSDNLEYDYKTNIVVYRGDVLAVQGETKVKSDTLTVTLTGRTDGAPTDPKADAKADPKTDPNASRQRLQEVIAVGNVRIDNGTRWATGGRAVFEQGTRTVVLTETPVLHDGANEVAGDRVIVYLDENRSVVEGGRKRVKAVLHPGKDEGIAPATPTPEAEAAAHGAAVP